MADPNTTLSLGDPAPLQIARPGESVDGAATDALAMIVCHGMGQQVPFETLSEVANTICRAHGTSHDRSAAVTLRLVRIGGDERLLPRAEIELSEPGRTRTVHLYEAYWAPLTEGVIGYVETARFLLGAGLSGIVAAWRRRFDRWMFGGVKWLPVKRNTRLLLAGVLVVLAPLLLLAGLIVATPTVVIPLVAKPWTAKLALKVLAVALVLLVFWRFRGFVVQYLGDVVIYVGSNRVNPWTKVREEIKAAGARVASAVYGAVLPGAAGRPCFAYRRVVVVGHSLGSVLAYDTLNAMVNADRLDGRARQVVERTEALITMGSPLDKTAFLFRQHVKEGAIREVLAAAVQPMIESYALRPEWWINVWCPTDLISGCLEYYDDPTAREQPRRVRNYADALVLNPVAAHTRYWNRRLGRTALYMAATGRLTLLVREFGEGVERPKPPPRPAAVEG